MSWQVIEPSLMPRNSGAARVSRFVCEAPSLLLRVVAQRRQALRSYNSLRTG